MGHDLLNRPEHRGQERTERIEEPEIAVGKRTLAEQHSPLQWLASPREREQSRGVSHGARQTGPTGDLYIDRGAACERDANAGASADCFLSGRQRDQLINKIMFRVVAARENFKHAVADLKTEELVKKPEDLHWILALAFDLAGAYFVMAASDALKGLRAAGIERLHSLSFRNAIAGVPDNVWDHRVFLALNAVTPTKIDSVTRIAFAIATTRAKTAAQKRQNAGATQQKSVKIAFLDSLRTECDVGFDLFVTQLTANATDAELILAHEAFEPDLHSVDRYADALRDKITRFMKSGAPEIGVQRLQLPEGHIETETRVVLVQDIFGNQVPWYAAKSSDYVGKGVVTRSGFQLTRPVPEEFWTVAITMSQAHFGSCEVIDDGYVSWLKAAGIDPAIMRARLLGSPVVAPQSRQPNPLEPFAEPATLPTESVFAQITVPDKL